MSVEDLRTERVCPRCGYTIGPGFIHEEVPQPADSNVVVCDLKRMPRGVTLRGPMVEVIARYFDDEQMKRRRWAIPQRLR